MLDSRSFYLTALPRDSGSNEVWDSHPTILTGKIVSLSESFNQVDIKTFACTNPRCRNSDHVIRHVGFDQLEHVEELGPSQIKPEVFITNAPSFSRSKSKNIIKCHNCREEISELYPFRSTIEFKVARLKVDGITCFPIDLLLVGSAVCSKVKLSNYYSLIGVPKFSAQVSDELKFIKRLQKSFYFEVYGVDPEVHVASTVDKISQVLDFIVCCTCESLRFPLLVLICQIIGSANGLHFNVSLPGIDSQIILKIANLLNLIFDSKNSIGSLKSNSINLKIPRQQKNVSFRDEVYPFLVNIVDTKETKTIHGISFIYCGIVEDDQIVYIPVDLSRSEEADIILKDYSQNHPKFQLPQGCITTPNLSESCVKVLQEHFLSLRNSKVTLPLKFSLDILTKFAQISALSRNEDEADVDDAEFSVMIHSKLMASEGGGSDFNFDDCLISPSVSFDSYF